MEINRDARQLFVEKVRRRWAAICAASAIGVWGLAFKPNTDDLREAPAIEIIQALSAPGAQVQAYDPVAMEKARQHAARRDLLRQTPTRPPTAPTRWCC